VTPSGEGPSPSADPGCLRPAVTIQAMTVGDLEAVGRIEALAMPTQWPPSTYRRELAGLSDGGYLVARRAGGDVIGFAGWSLVHGEAHVTIIAVHPAHRRRRVGQRLLADLIARAEARGATVLTLEVRVSNLAAFCLYQRFGFREVGRRQRYYGDTGEDAIIMTTPPLADAAWRARFAQLAAERLPEAEPAGRVGSVGDGSGSEAAACEGDALR
jgi:[ribosomal protein S18]-alanine N-acetyltransferase